MRIGTSPMMEMTEAAMFERRAADSPYRWPVGRPVPHQLASRRREVISCTKPASAEILLSLSKSKSGRSRLIDTDESGGIDNVAVSGYLIEKEGISQAKTTRILGIGRQMVNKYMKDMGNE